MPPSVPIPGDVVDDKYVIARMLGKGGMGVVYEATHKKLDQRVAIKFLLPDELERADSVARFDREARAAALLRSAHAVRVLDVDATKEGLPYIVMEYLEGRDVGTELRNRQKIPLGEAIDWLLQTCVAMAEAHARGIIHRDLKPANLFLCTSESGPPLLKVMDFGISKLAAVAGETDLTTTETTLGTPSYMAPEQLVSAKTIDHRADVWALGVVLYRLLAGQLPFRGPTPTALAIAIATAQPAPISLVAPWVPPAVADAIMKALERDPARRHADAIVFGQCLEPFGSGAFGFAQAIARLPPAPSSSSAVAAAKTYPMEKTLAIPGAAVDAENAATGSAWEGRGQPSRARQPASGLVKGIALAASIILAFTAVTFFVVYARNRRLAAAASPPVDSAIVVAPASVAPPVSETPPAPSSSVAALPPEPAASASASSSARGHGRRPPPNVTIAPPPIGSAPPQPPQPPQPKLPPKPASTDDPLHI